MRKKLFITFMLIGIMVLAAAGAWAATVSAGRTTNVITTGGVHIAVNEYREIEGRLAPYNPEISVPVMPTRSVSKIVKIGNTGESAAWVRVKFALEISGLPEGVAPDTRLVKLDISDAGAWVSGGDGWYYYTQRLEKGEETPPSLQSVSFDSGMGNEYQNTQVAVTVTAEAVQCANNGDSFEKALGWPTDVKGGA